MKYSIPLFLSLVISVLSSSLRAEEIVIKPFTVSGLKTKFAGKKIFALPVRGRPTGLYNIGEAGSFIIKDILNWGSSALIQSDGKASFSEIKFQQDDFSDKILNYIVIVIADIPGNKLNLNIGDGPAPTLPSNSSDLNGKWIDSSSVDELYYISSSTFFNREKSASSVLLLNINSDFSR